MWFILIIQVYFLLNISLLIRQTHKKHELIQYILTPLFPEYHHEFFLLVHT